MKTVQRCSGSPGSASISCGTPSDWLAGDDVEVVDDSDAAHVEQVLSGGRGSGRGGLASARHGRGHALMAATRLRSSARPAGVCRSGQAARAFLGKRTILPGSNGMLTPAGQASSPGGQSSMHWPELHAGPGGQVSRAAGLARSSGARLHSRVRMMCSRMLPLSSPRWASAGLLHGHGFVCAQAEPLASKAIVSIQGAGSTVGAGLGQHDAEVGGGRVGQGDDPVGAASSAAIISTWSTCA